MQAAAAGYFPNHVEKDAEAESSNSCSVDENNASFLQNLREATANLYAAGGEASDPIIAATLFATAEILGAYGCESAAFIATQFKAFAVADLGTGAVHWGEDSYGSEETPLIGELIIKPNRLHHAKAREFLKNSFFQKTGESMIAATIAVAVFYQVLDPESFVFFSSVAFWASLANQIHAWEHMPAEEIPWVVKKLQGIILQTPKQHHVHHRDTDKSYCVMSPWFNGFLNWCGVWRALEYGVFKLTGVEPRLDERAQANKNKTAVLTAITEAKKND